MIALSAITVVWNRRHRHGRGVLNDLEAPLLPKGLAADDKFVTEMRFLRLGLATDQALGIEHLLGMNPVDFAGEEEAFIEKEFTFAGDRVREPVPEKHQANFHAVRSGTNLLPPHKPWNTGGKTIEELLQHPDAVSANLKRHHILALRLYTTSSYVLINAPMREDPPQRPHPFAVTTYCIAEGIKQLRRLHAGHSTEVKTLTFWRGVADRGLSAEFRTKGGTEFACMSTTLEKKQAFRFATKHGKTYDCPLLLKVTTDKASNRGADIAFLSVFEGEKEVLYPPLTYMRSLSRPQKEQFKYARSDGTTGTTTVLVAEVEPTIRS
jgi:hypothetical protein